MTQLLGRWGGVAIHKGRSRQTTQGGGKVPGQSEALAEKGLTVNAGGGVILDAQVDVLGDTKT